MTLSEATLSPGPTTRPPSGCHGQAMASQRGSYAGDDEERPTVTRIPKRESGTDTTSPASSGSFSLRPAAGGMSYRIERGASVATGETYDEVTVSL